MERNDFWKEEEYFVTANFSEDIKRLSPEQLEQYLRDLKSEIVDNGMNDAIHDLFLTVDLTIIERFPDVFMDLVKIDPGEISFIPQSVLKQYPEALKDVREEDWKSNLSLLNVGHIPSEMARKYRSVLLREAETCESNFINIKNLPVETVRENPWLLTEIIKYTRAEDRFDIIDELPEEIKEQYGTTLRKACAIFGKIDELHAMREKAARLEREIDDVFRETIKEDQKRRIGDDEDGIR